MVFPAILIPVLASAGTALVTGLATYFAFRPAAIEPTVNTSKGDIDNSVKVNIEEHHRMTANGVNVNVILVSIILIIKLIELTLYTIRACRRSLKKSYHRQQATAINNTNV